ncbi:unnamed protein product [Cyprideis torosa]|uniref:Uncharacterized protein n=1 Tax=Cyprideis torosa TaxID=163714 RepID=A0A7R8WML7_9CRUS|nr:unnamed protein product [Cyprideis torosa]CAG0905376.1 unnamed protein product [Cyprideis torosa]
MYFRIWSFVCLAVVVFLLRSTSVEGKKKKSSKQVDDDMDFDMDFDDPFAPRDNSPSEELDQENDFDPQSPEYKDDCKMLKEQIEAEGKRFKKCTVDLLMEYMGKQLSLSGVAVPKPDDEA